MTRPLLALPALWLSAACAAGPAALPGPPGYGIAAWPAPAPERPAEIIEMPVPLPLPGQLKPAPEMDTGPRAAPAKPVSPVRAITEGASAARIEPSAGAYVNAVQVYPYTEGALYQLYASPGQVTDIALQPGERLMSVSAGDTARWIVGDTLSGSGTGARVHVLVKPVAAGLATNLMIATDRRTYHLELTSLETAYMAALSWHYPSDALANLASANARALQQEAAIAAPGVRLEDLNFDYRIDGDRPDWRPLLVFDDGRRVFIQMPAGLSATEAPPLFVTGAGGGAELVNYRVRGNYYIVDHLFTAAELRLGQRPQTVVRIRRGKATGRGAG